MPMTDEQLRCLTQEERRWLDQAHWEIGREERSPIWPKAIVERLTTIAALRQRVEELREQITNGRSAHNDDRVRADTLWRDRDTLRQRVAGLEKVMRSVRTSMIELGPMNAADISNDVIGEIDAALAARPTGGEG